MKIKVKYEYVIRNKNNTNSILLIVTQNKDRHLCCLKIQQQFDTFVKMLKHYQQQV